MLYRGVTGKATWREEYEGMTTLQPFLLAFILFVSGTG